MVATPDVWFQVDFQRALPAPISEKRSGVGVASAQTQDINQGMASEIYTLPQANMEADRRGLEDYFPFGEPLCPLPCLLVGGYVYTYIYIYIYTCV